MLYPTTLSISCTKGRHFHIERTLRLFLDQDYEGKHILLIYNNSSIKQTLGELQLPNNKEVILINQHLDLDTGLPYKTLGAIYKDVLKCIPDQVEIVNHQDDDDLCLPNHITKGVEGLQLSGKTAYKPKKSYLLTSDGISLAENVMEPSIFIKVEHLKEHGYWDNTENQHHKWLQPLIIHEEICVAPLGEPTFCYTWNGGVFKTSGDPSNILNFLNYEKNSQVHGDLIINPCPKEVVQNFYKQINDYTNNRVE